MKIRTVSLLGAAVGLTLATALAVPTVGAAPDGDQGAPSANRHSDVAGLAAVNAAAGRQRALGATATSLRRELGTRTAGSYLDPSGRLMVNVLDAAAAAVVRSAGATPRMVARSTGQLAATRRALDSSVRAPGTVVATDPRTNQVVVTVTGSVSATDQARLRSAAARLGPAVRMTYQAGGLRPLLSGGDAIFTGGARCSAGFNVTDGTQEFLITAGHCTEIGSDWFADGNGAVSVGATVASSFPTDDYGVVRYDGDVDRPGDVNLYDGSVQDITSAGTAVPGESVCRSGSTTGVDCGRVLAVDATVNYAEGTVFGLIHTDVCAEPGDSGGALFDGPVALGITSGGSGNCTLGGETFFQPVDEPLELFGLSVT